MHRVCVLRFDRVMTERRNTTFDTDCGNEALRVIKYHNFSHELYVMTAAAASSADRVDEWEDQQAKYNNLKTLER